VVDFKINLNIAKCFIFVNKHINRQYPGKKCSQCSNEDDLVFHSKEVIYVLVFNFYVIKLFITKIVPHP